MQKMLYTNLIVITNQKPVIDMQRIKRKESKYITKERQQSIEREQEKKGSEKIYRNNHKTMTKCKKMTNTYQYYFECKWTKCSK